jgi:hypothetical protein
MSIMDHKGPKRSKTPPYPPLLPNLEKCSLSLDGIALFLQVADLFLDLVPASLVRLGSLLSLQRLKSSLHLLHLSQQVALGVVTDRFGLLWVRIEHNGRK